MSHGEAIFFANGVPVYLEIYNYRYRYSLLFLRNRFTNFSFAVPILTHAVAAEQWQTITHMNTTVGVFQISFRNGYQNTFLMLVTKKGEARQRSKLYSLDFPH